MGFLTYSDRMAEIGSIRAARIAGSREARLATTPRARTEPTITHGPRGEVSKRKLARVRETSIAMANPTAEPAYRTIAL
jgi:hypothetical protein